MTVNELHIKRQFSNSLFKERDGLETETFKDWILVEEGVSSWQRNQNTADASKVISHPRTQ